MGIFWKLLLGLGLFLAIHLVAALPRLRARFELILGANGYRAVHSLVTIVALVLMVTGFMTREFVPLWDLGAVGALAPIMLMPLALFLILSGHLWPGVQAITRHPMLWGVVLFAVAHLLANGDRSSAALFGFFLFYGLLAQWLNDRKKRLSEPDIWVEIAAKTSSIPFAAILGGRAAWPASDGLVRTIVAAAVLVAVLVWAHPLFTGVALLPG